MWRAIARLGSKNVFSSPISLVDFASSASCLSREVSDPPGPYYQSRLEALFCDSAEAHPYRNVIKSGVNAFLFRFIGLT